MIFVKTKDTNSLGVRYYGFSEWSIGIYKYYDKDVFLKVLPYPQIRNPVLTAKDVKDRKDVYYVADPFLVKEQNTYYMFFEVLSADRGRIGVATSKDCIKWEYQKIVLDEPFHLSYPHVFKWEGRYYMVPESHEDRSIRLYEAKEFPYKWQFIKKLMEGDTFLDTTVFRYQNKWWMFAAPKIENTCLMLYYSDSLEGPWVEHPQNPIVKNNNHMARPAGSIINLKGKLIRLAQDDSLIYGYAVRAFEILKLDPQEYKERELSESPLLKASGKGWNKNAMHHLSVCQINNEEIIAAVDGDRETGGYFFYLKLPEVLGKFLVRLDLWFKDLSEMFS